MSKLPLLFVLLSLIPSPARAQLRLYAGGTVGMNAGTGSPFDTVGTFAAAGGFVGWRFHDAWSLEFHLESGFGESAEREELEIFGHSIVQDVAGRGGSVLLTWKLRQGSRVGAAVTMGLSMMGFRKERLSFTKDRPDDPYPVSLGTARTDGGGGWTGGVFFPIALGGRWSIAPEVRITPLAVTGESGAYRQVYAGVRGMWGF
jgi:hypothetical protein